MEELLYNRSEILECAVIGLPDPEWGECVTALFVLQPDTCFDKETINNYLKSRLSPFKVPKQYLNVSAFPKSPAGKILKRELKKKLLEVASKPHLS